MTAANGTNKRENKNLQQKRSSSSSWRSRIERSNGTLRFDRNAVSDHRSLFSLSGFHRQHRTGFHRELISHSALVNWLSLNTSFQIYRVMSFVFRGTRADVEGGFPGFMPERRALRVHGARPSNSNSLTFLVTVLLLFMILNSHQMSPNFLLWLVLGVFLMATMLRMYATCQQLQAQAQAHAHAAAASGLLGHTELRLHMPPSIALATRGRLQGLRLQLALLDREFDNLDYEALRALDSDNVPTAPSMTEEEINALPVHEYKVSGPQNGASSAQQASSSTPGEKKQDSSNAVGSMKASDDELTCSVCLEQVIVGDLLRSLPCLHQFHASCIDPWLRQQGTCPVCKFRAGSGWHETGQNDIADMV